MRRDTKNDGDAATSRRPGAELLHDDVIENFDETNDFCAKMMRIDQIDQFGLCAAFKHSGLSSITHTIHQAPHNARALRVTKL